MSTENRPEILLLSLAYVDFLDDMYKSLFSNLVESARLKRVKKANVALCYLDANNPKAIIITDQGLTDPRHNEVLQKVQTYIHSGGLAIVGLHFPNFASWDVFDHFFAFGFELPWKAGDYARITRPASCLRVWNRLRYLGYLTRRSSMSRGLGSMRGSWFPSQIPGLSRLAQVRKTPKGKSGTKYRPQ